MQIIPPSSARHIDHPLGAILMVLALIGAVSPVTHANNGDNFAAFDALLLQNVHHGFIDYDAMAGDTRLVDTLNYISTASPAAIAGQDGGLAFHINAYNAMAIQGVLNGQTPLTRRSRKKFFNKQKFAVLGESVSLAVIERDRILSQGDARVHFALACASMSCPRLSSHAYQPDKLNLQLHDAAQRFINDPTRNLFDLERRIAIVSRIFEQHSAEFETAGGSVQKYIARFVDNARVQDALRAEEFEIRYAEYDWNLNGHFSRAAK